jgi:hypothetical protein
VLDLEEVPHFVEIMSPSGVWPVPPQDSLGVRTPTPRHGLDLCDCLAVADDRVALTVVFNGIEEVGEAASGISSADFGHEIRLSDCWVSSRRFKAPELL